MANPSCHKLSSSVFSVMDTYILFDISSHSWLHNEWSYIWVGREGSRAGSRWTDVTSVYTEGREGSALLHQAL